MFETKGSLSRRASRSGFTLVELLVVIGIMGVLAGIGLYAYRPLQDRSGVNNAAMMVQAWLNTAKNRALRDQAPRGVRFLAGTEVPEKKNNANPLYITRAVYLEQEEDYFGGRLYHHPKAPPAVPQKYYNNPKQVSPPGSRTFFLDDLLPPEITIVGATYLEIEGGVTHRVVKISPQNNFYLNKVVSAIEVEADHPYEVTPDGDARFRLFREPTVQAGGDEVLQLPRGAVINLEPNNTSGFFQTTPINYENQFQNFLTFNGGSPPIDVEPDGTRVRKVPPPVTPPGAGGHLDIMFSPDGSLRSPSPNENGILLWICGTQTNMNNQNINPVNGQPALVAIYPRTGMVAGYSVDISVGDPSIAKWTANPYSQVVK